MHFVLPTLPDQGPSRTGVPSVHVRRPGRFARLLHRIQWLPVAAWLVLLHGIRTVSAVQWPLAACLVHIPPDRSEQEPPKASPPVSTVRRTEVVP